MTKYYYRHLACGGTFDHLHQGHKYFLEQAFLLAEKVTIGITDYAFYQKILPDSIEPFAVRKQQLADYLSKHNWLARSQLVAIFDSCGGVNQNRFVDAILHTKDNIERVEIINYERQKNGLQKLKTVKSDLLADYSSTRIRQGYFRQGLSLHNSLYLPGKHRHLFQKPLGKLFYSPNNLSWSALKAKHFIAKNKAPFVAVVGDVASFSFIEQNISFNLAVLDHKTRREPIITTSHRRLKKQSNNISTVINPASSLHLDLVKKCQIYSQKTGQNTIIVKGEEDLTVLPLILFSPLNSLIFYGQPHQGLVAVKVSTAKKNECLKLLNYFR